MIVHERARLGIGREGGGRRVGERGRERKVDEGDSEVLSNVVMSSVVGE